MAIFSSDTFTEGSDTALSAHTGEVGATWTIHGSYSLDCIVKAATDTLEKENNGSTLLYTDGTPDTAEYDVEIDVIKKAASITASGVVGRVVTSLNTFYMARYDVDNAIWQLHRVNGGSFSLLGSFAQTLTIDQVYRIKLQIRTAAKKLFIDDVERISSTNNDIGAAGKAGIRFYNDSDSFNDLIFNNFLGTDLATGPVIYNRTLSSGLDITDPQSRASNLLRQLEANIAINDFQLIYNIYSRLTGDDVSMADTLGSVRLFNRDLISDISTSDFIISTVSAAAVIERILSSNINLFDIDTREVLATRSLEDILVIADTIGIAVHYNRLLNEQLLVNDALISIKGKILDRALSSSLNVNDALTTELLINRLLVSTIAAVDVINKQLNLSRLLRDDVDSVLDLLIKLGVFNIERILSDTLGISDILSRDFSGQILRAIIYDMVSSTVIVGIENALFINAKVVRV